MNRDKFLAFAASLQNLSKDEIHKAKVLYIKNAIISYKSSFQSDSLSLLLLASICIFMFFMLVINFDLFLLLPLFLFSIMFLNIKTGFIASKQIINNAIEVWQEDLGDDYFNFKAELEKIKLKIPIVNITIA